MGTPNTPPPPGQPPYGQDPWRWQREQQRQAAAAQQAAYRAQREAARNAWRVQRAQIKAQSAPSFVGPVMLIAIGVIALLLITGHLPAWQFWSWYGHWWPVLLIVAGLAMLVEWGIDARRGTTIRRRRGILGPILLVAGIGIVAAILTHTHDWAKEHLDDWSELGITNGNSDDFFGSLGQPERTHDDTASFPTIPANATIEIQNPRGDISVTAIDGNVLTVQSHETIRSGDDSPNFTSLKPQVTVSGSAVLIKLNATEGRSNLTLTVPKSASINVNAAHGDVTVAGITANANVTADHGDVHLDSITGNTQTRMTKGDFSAHDITGTVAVSGHADDATLSTIHGAISLDGDFFGDVQVEDASGEVRFHSSRSEIDIPRLTGDLSLDDDSLHVTGTEGQVKVRTTSKDIELAQVTGGADITDSHATVTVQLMNSAPTSIHNREGNIELTLPTDANFNVNATTRNGDIISDFPVPQTTGGDTKVISTTIGKGGANLVLSTENGDLNLKRGGASQAAPQPQTDNAPVQHLHAHKGTQTKPVAQ